MKEPFTILALVTGCLLCSTVSNAAAAKTRHEPYCEFKVVAPEMPLSNREARMLQDVGTAEIDFSILKPSLEKSEHCDKVIAIDKSTGNQTNISFPPKPDPSTGMMGFSTETSCKLPYGEYYFAAPIKSTFSMSLVIKEVSVAGNCSVDFCSDEATIQPRFVTTMPNGEELQLPFMEFIDEEPWVNYIEKGNAEQLYATIWLKHDIFGHLFRIDFGLYGDNASDMEAPDFARSTDWTNIRFSPLDDNFSVWVQKTIITDDGIVFANSGTKTISNKVITNTNNEYVIAEADFRNTPASEKYKDSPEYSLKFSIWYDNIEQQHMGLWLTKPIAKAFFYNSPESEKEGFVSAVNFTYPDGAVTRIIQDDGYEYEETETFNIITNPVIVRDNHVEYVNRHHSNIDIGRNFQNTPDGNFKIELPGHPRFSFTDNQPAPIYGNSSPICSLKTQVQTGDIQGVEYNIFNPSYLGRYGEARFADRQDLEISLKYNGEECLLPGEPLNVWAARFGNEKHPYGVFDLEIANHNVRVDDEIQGHNTMRAHVDWTTGDKYAPTLQMLMFRNGDGVITDRFENAEGNCVEYAGADFLFHDATPYHFTHLPATACTEYSPYGQNLWTELETEELPEYFFMPNFGYFYRCSLSSVSIPSDNKWYDLRITIKDEAGNYQEQVISPAFRLETPASGVGEVSMMETSEIKSIHNLFGITQQNLNKGINIITLNNGKTVKIIR
jgi:hypothetical protein